MKQIFLSMCALALCSTLVSCNKESDDHADQAVHEHAEHDEHAESGGSGIEGLSLNEGEKWAMDEHTRDAFAAMASSFVPVDHEALSSDELKAAGAGIQEQLVGLIQGCTMTGASHDQLHILLTGYMGAVDALAKGGEHGDAETVKHYLKEYGEYFE